MEDLAFIKTPRQRYAVDEDMTVDEFAARNKGAFKSNVSGEPTVAFVAVERPCMIDFNGNMGQMEWHTR